MNRDKNDSSTKNSVENSLLQQIRSSSRGNTPVGGKTKRTKVALVLVDILVLLLLAAIVLLVLSYFTTIPIFEKKMPEVSVVCNFELDTQDNSYSTLLQNGKEVYLFDNGTSIGTITNVESVSDHLVITTQFTAEYQSGEGYYLNGNRIAMEHTYQLLIDGVLFDVVCCSLKG